MEKWSNRSMGRAALLPCLLLAATLAWAQQVVTEQLPSGKTVSAGLLEPKNPKAAALVLHGFLQTREFPTVTSVAEALAGADLAVLTPSLSLGISSRKSSLPCEALHIHGFEGDVAEVAFWVRWLTARGHKHIVLVGHSFGSLHILAYLARKPAPEVVKTVLISLADVEGRQDAGSREQLARSLRERLARKDPGLVGVEFGQCKKYVSPPAALLSYVSITRATILEWLTKAKSPVEVIMGGADDRMGRGWVDRLTMRGDAVHVIPGANHFFDNQFEFDLQDAVVRAVSTLPGSVR